MSAAPEQWSIWSISDDGKVSKFCDAGSKELADHFVDLLSANGRLHIAVRKSLGPPSFSERAAHA
ncbi:MAG: hypothetical protein AAGJ40_09340 [Planctomycetota bacterium]